MAIALTAFNEPFGKDLSSQRIWLHGLLTITATTYAAGGILPTSYANILDQSGQKVQLATYNVNPDDLWLQSISGSGFSYSYNKATGKIQIWVLPFPVQSAVNTGLVEYSNAALSAAVLADIVTFEGQWVRL